MSFNYHRVQRFRFYWPKIVILIVFPFLASCQVILPSSGDQGPSQYPLQLPTPATETPTATTFKRIEATQTTVSLHVTPTITDTLIPTPSPTITPTSTKLPFASGPITIGESAGGRPLDVYRFGTGDIKRMVVAGIHGGYEWNTIKLADMLIEQINKNPELIPEDITLYILPNFNPDGEVRGHDKTGRANDHGVDLNRNFSENWKLDWNRSGCWQMAEITGGKYPFSEPESTALATFLSIHSIDALISYHSAGKGIYPGGHSSHLASNDLAKTLASVSTYPYPGFETGCETSGMLVDYAAASGIAAVDLELFTHWDTELSTNLEVLKTFLAWKFKP